MLKIAYLNQLPALSVNFVSMFTPRENRNQNKIRKIDDSRTCFKNMIKIDSKLVTVYACSTSTTLEVTGNIE